MGKRTVNYRKIYKEHYGPIPKDENGRSFQIHHEDGNRDNNDTKNLVALSIVDHFWVHWINGDYGACKMIASKMKVPPEVLSELSRRTALQGVEKGTNPFCDREAARKRALERVANKTHIFCNGVWQRKQNLERVKKGTHHFLGPETNSKRVANKTHPFLGGELQRTSAKEQIEKGTFVTQITKECEHCGMVCNSGNYARWHGDKCKHK